MNERPRLLIISDIHSFSFRPDDVDEPSYAKANVTPNPFTELLALLSEDPPLQADLLVCAGDICDQADEQGLDYAWGRLNEVASKSGATLVATAGNHDLDSRFLKNSFNPKGALQALRPTFPHESPSASDMYWARNFSAFRHVTAWL
jgi:predicted MPP superfamily phosphohydrolase